MSLQNCPVCGKSLKRLTRHLNHAHKSTARSKEATTMQEFAQLCQLIPVTNDEWSILWKYQKDINKLAKSRSYQLPTRVFSVFYTAFEKYQNSPRPKLLINDVQQLKIQSPRGDRVGDGERHRPDIQRDGYEQRDERSGVRVSESSD